MAEESKSGQSGADMFEGMGKKSGPASAANVGPQSRRSVPPPPPSISDRPAPVVMEAKRTLLGIPTPPTAAVPPPKSLPAAALPPRSVPAPPAATQPAGGAPTGGASLEMDWDDENEATTVFEGKEGALGEPGQLSAVAPNTTPTTTRGTGTAPPPPPASASMRAAVKGISVPPAGPSVSQAVGPISAAQSESVLGKQATAVLPVPGAAPVSARIPAPPGSIGARRSAPPPSAAAPVTAPLGARPPSAPPPASIPAAPEQAPVATTLASANGSIPAPAAEAPAVQDVQVTAPLLPRSERPRPLEATALVRPEAAPAGSNKLGGVLLGGALVALLAGGAYFALGAREGSITVTATDARNANLDRVSVFVNGQRTVCETSPCTLKLAAGAHTIKVVADGLDTPEPKQITVENGGTLPVAFSFAAASGTTPVAPASTQVGSTTAPASTGGTGLRVSALGQGLKLSVDGKEVGTLPQELKDLSPGAHTLKIGGDRYETLEKTVTVTQGQIVDVGNVAPKVVKGLATVQGDTPGAKIYLVSGKDRREVPPLPQVFDVEVSRGWTLEATKAGFQDLHLPLTFEDGQAERTFTVTLQPKAAATTPSAPSTPTTSKPSGGSTSVATSKPTASDSKPAASGEGTLNINSVPASNVVLDGKPLGETPKAGIKVSAGTHTVLFINSAEGLKKKYSVTVKAGETVPVIGKLR